MRLNQEDYLDPSCALCGKPGEIESVRPVPQDRILSRLREYEDRNDWPAVERHLQYWLAEAEANRDLRGQLMLRNELMGYYRKQSRGEDARFQAAQADQLITRLGMEDTVTAGTTRINIGTVLEAFGDPEAALASFETARRIYERHLPPDDGRLGGLYNNMGLALSARGRFAECRELFQKALDVMALQPHGELEQAITWLNLADAVEAEVGPEAAAERVEPLLDRAGALLDTASLPRNGYYAFVCEKCAPVFGHYGYFLKEAELKRRAEEIHERP